MAVTDIMTLDGVSVESASVMNRDCSFAINDMRPINPPDDVVRMMPITIGSWADDMIAPAIDEDGITIDHTADGDDCDAPQVTQALGSCFVTAPNMAVFDLKSPKLEITKLLPEFCKQRNIVMNEELRSLFLPNGTINPGNRYATDYFRWAYEAVARGLALWITENGVAGDSANTEHLIDGLYTQLAGGWTDASSGDACGDALNKENTIDWGALCGKTGGADAYPDDVTVAGKSVSLWGQTLSVPAGYNLAQLLDWMYFPKVRANFTDQYGDVQWEMHVPHGACDDFLATAACMQPCTVSGEFDSELRARFSGFISSRVARLYPHGEILPVMETRYMPANTMRIGPRSIGGNPTYSMFFKNINQYWEDVFSFGETYGNGRGMRSGTEPMLKRIQDRVGIQAIDQIAFHYDFEKVGHKCLYYSVLSQAGFLATSRHLWLKLTNVAYNTWINTPASVVTHTTS